MKRSAPALALLFLMVACAGSDVASSPASDAEGTEPGTPPPNFLIFLADDMAWCDAGFAGNSEVPTPVLDRLAREGMTFTRAFTVTAMCSPSRQALYTGLFPVRSGAFPNHSKVQTGTRSVVHHLHALGYRVGLIGKKHFGPDESYPFDRVPRMAGGAPARLTEFIKDPQRHPWCVVVASSHPHTPWESGQLEVDPSALTLPPPLVDTPETRDCLARYYREINALDGSVGQCLDALRDSGQESRTIVMFTSEQGPQFPGGKWTCYDYGLRTALIVRGPGIAAGSTTDAMVQYVDVVPTLIDLAGGDSRDADTGRPDAAGDRGFDGWSFADVLSGVRDHHRDQVFGVHTTKGIIQGHPYPIRSVRGDRFKLIVNLLPDATFQNVEIVEDRQGYWSSWTRAAETNPVAADKVERYLRRPAFELYDIREDPFEQHNLAADPDLEPVIRELQGELQRWMAQQGDLGVETENAVKYHKSVADGS